MSIILVYHIEFPDNPGNTMLMKAGEVTKWSLYPGVRLLSITILYHLVYHVASWSSIVLEVISW